jgi:broad specificity phosphatase PhoE
MTTLVLVRHGETEWNRKGRWQGHADIPLSDEGRAQARLLAERLRREGALFDHIYASDLHRAFETASIVAETLNMPVNPLIQLREMHVGAWSGMTSAEVRERHPDQWERYARGEDGPRGGHGETRAALTERVVGTIEELVRTHPGQHLLVVTHGGPVHSLLSHIQRQTGDVTTYRIDNTALTEICFEPGGPRIIRVNDTQHLEQPATIGDEPTPF